MASQLETNITTLQEQIYGASFDISKSFLPDNEIVKNILMSKNPAMSKAESTKIVDGYGTASNAPKNYPLPKNGTYYDKVSKVKAKVRKAAAMIIKEEKALIQDLIKTAIQTSVSISGAAIMMAPVSFNVPAAISLILLVVNAISAIIDRLLNILLWIEPLKSLSLLIDPKQFDITTAPINASILSIMGIFAPISALKAFIDLLMGQMKSMTSPSNLTSQIAQVKSKISQDQSNIKNTTDPTTIASLNTDLNNQNAILAQLTGTNLPVTKNGEFDETELKNTNPDIYNTIQSIQNLADKISAGQEIFLYDVKLPNGQTLLNIDDAALDKIKQTYNVVFDNQNSV